MYDIILKALPLSLCLCISFKADLLFPFFFIYLYASYIFSSCFHISIYVNIILFCWLNATSERINEENEEKHIHTWLHSANCLTHNLKWTWHLMNNYGINDTKWEIDKYEDIYIWKHLTTTKQKYSETIYHQFY